MYSKLLFALFMLSSTFALPRRGELTKVEKLERHNDTHLFKRGNPKQQKGKKGGEPIVVVAIVPAGGDVPIINVV